ncbi:centrosome and spindle pole-associated protein 1 isoform X2 [Brienomyrus brachyistius]|uniref:centrosome and spindle pole-associated protein 1 isoform X2 n=1 Tax=Brienomyrus brachyistius TaxID=42636 RepID=UPI0020B3ABD2|nr:centrosome and spindle pole-associated protein 1 isoform X2 [Brienomyrus brachyistius]
MRSQEMQISGPMANQCESSLQEQKAKLANERMRLGQDPPYMEMRALIDDAYKASVKENIPPSMRSPPPSLQAQQKGMPGPSLSGDSFGASLPLGGDYERKKQQLQQELRLDYRRYMAQETSRQRKEQSEQRTVEASQHLGLSLPIGERKSAKVGDDPHSAPRSMQSVSLGASEVDLQQPSRRDVATLTEAERRSRPRGGRSLGPDEGAHRPPRGEDDSGMDFSEDEWEHLAKRRPRVGREPGRVEMRGRRARTRAPDRDETDDLEDYTESRTYAQTRIPQGRRRHQPPDAPDGENAEDKMAPVTPKHANLGTRLCVRLRVPEEAKGTERSGSAGGRARMQFATGLMIGAAEGQMTMQKKKERYRQELLEQIAEQQRNRKREKEMEMKVAATGAVDPEKQPDRIKHFGAVSHDQDRTRDVPDRPGLGIRSSNSAGRPPPKEKPPLDTKEKAPPARPRIAFHSPLLDYSAALEALAGTGATADQRGNGLIPLAQSEDLHKNLSSTLGEIAASQIHSVPPPAPPTVAEAYRTPFDQAYFYYGVRNPLEMGSAFGGPAGGGARAATFFAPEHPQGQLGHAESVPQTAWQSGRVSGESGIASPPGRLHRRSKESAISYQDALRQQIQEREERRRQEEAERERYETRLQAEMKAYNPWGKGGGGAPLKDHQGNLLTDLKQMNRSNKEVYVTPGAQDQGAAGQVVVKVPAPQGQDAAPSGNGMSGCSHASPFARGNVFVDLPTPQQLQEQERYKDILRRQIEEKRRREAEEQERLRLEDEKEERRLAEQRAHIQQEYEQEQEKRRRKEQEQMAKNDELVRQAEQRRREAERKRCEEEERLSAALKERYERERQARLEEKVHREPSPPIPALQNKLAGQRTVPPPSSDTPHSASVLSESSLPAPPSPPVPAHRNQQRAKEEHTGVVRELSALRRQLRSKQRVLEEQLQQRVRTEDPESPGSVRVRDRPPVDVFDMARMRQQAPVRRPMNLQNIQDFNQLKYRDGESREEVRHRYPDPPTDEQSLEIQQQALLREQQRRGKRADAAGPHVPLTQQSAPPPMMGVIADAMRGSPLQSHSMFLKPNEGIMLDPYEWGQNAPSRPVEEMHLVKRRGSDSRRPRQEANLQGFPSFQQQPRTSGTAAGHWDSSSPRSGTSLNIEQLNKQNQQRMRDLEDLHRWELGLNTLADEEVDPALRVLQSSLDRRFSMDTVATEPWLRPGTSDAVKRHTQSGTGFRKPSLPTWEGPSTYHG